MKRLAFVNAGINSPVSIALGRSAFPAALVSLLKSGFTTS